MVCLTVVFVSTCPPRPHRFQSLEFPRKKDREYSISVLDTVRYEAENQEAYILLVFSVDPCLAYFTLQDFIFLLNHSEGMVIRLRVG